MNSEELAKAIAALKKAFDLDALEIGKNSLYLHFGRDLQNHELLRLTTAIHQIQEAME